MKLVRCHIENFGKLHDKSIEFQDGLNIVHAKNGTGKSTLAMFIKVMFFGFSNGRKHSDVENERKFYKPWQGGTFGGQLTFQIEERIYTVERTFGAKESEDTFVLYDAQTQLESRDYSANIGEELLQIDQAAFMRTVFIAQNECETKATDSINAKLGNLVEETGDINNYESVYKKLSDELNMLSPTRKTGSIYKLKAAVAQYKEELRRTEGLHKEKEELLQQQEEIRLQREDLKKSCEDIQRQMELAEHNQHAKGTLDRYEELCMQYTDMHEKYEREAEYFPGRVPEEEEVKEQLQLANQLSAYRQTMEAEALSESQNSQLERCQGQFAEEPPTLQEVENQLSEWTKKLKTQNALGAKKASLIELRQPEIPQQKQKKVKKQKKQKKGGSGVAGIFIMLLGIIAVLAGAAVLADVAVLADFVEEEFLTPEIGIGIVGLGVLFLIIGLVVKLKKRPVQEEPEEEEVPEIDQQGAFESLQEEIWRDEEEITRIAEEVRGFLRGYGIKCEEQEVQEKLYNMKLDLKEYAGLKEQKDKYQNAQENCRQTKEQLDTFIMELSMEPQDDIPQQLSDIRQHIYQYTESKEALRQAIVRRDEFEQEHHVEAIKSGQALEEIPSMAELNEQMNTAMEQLDETARQYTEGENRLRELEGQQEDFVRTQENLTQAQEEIERLQNRYLVLEKTREYLEKAREAFTARYMNPLLKGFAKYYRMLTGQEAKNYRMNANMQVKVKEKGRLRDIQLFSAGSQDLTGICMRMAMVDAMYREEKPFVVFDDPFVNLDEDKVERGLALLTSISEEYQVLYFTCHASRSL